MTPEGFNSSVNMQILYLNTYYKDTCYKPGNFECSHYYEPPFEIAFIELWAHKLLWVLCALYFCEHYGVLILLLWAHKLAQNCILTACFQLILIAINSNTFQYILKYLLLTWWFTTVCCNKPVIWIWISAIVMSHILLPSHIGASVTTIKFLILDASNPKTWMFLVSSCRCLCAIY